MMCPAIPVCMAGTNLEISSGMLKIELAKITGMTEHVLSGIGNVLSANPASFLDCVTLIFLPSL